MITRENSFKLRLCYIFLEDTKYMTILTRQERERLVLDLYYNQGKTYRQISKEANFPRIFGFQSEKLSILDYIMKILLHIFCVS